MTSTHPIPLTHDRIEANLSPADDRVLLNNWLPPQVGVVIGQSWINELWSLPVGFVLAVVGVAVAQALRNSSIPHQINRQWMGLSRARLMLSRHIAAWVAGRRYLFQSQLSCAGRCGLICDEASVISRCAHHSSWKTTPA
jgi:sulfoxide reductase catalytic subunit YedY